MAFRVNPLARWLVVGSLAVAATAALAADDFALMIQDHTFQPAELRVPANRKVKLVITNRDASAEEFESHALNREKVVPPGKSVTIYVGPLAPGRYPFFGEFHQKTAQGAVIAE